MHGGLNVLRGPAWRIRGAAVLELFAAATNTAIIPADNVSATNRRHEEPPCFGADSIPAALSPSSWSKTSNFTRNTAFFEKSVVTTWRAKTIVSRPKTTVFDPF
jgi:hypothetical protein